MILHQNITISPYKLTITSFHNGSSPSWKIPTSIEWSRGALSHDKLLLCVSTPITGLGINVWIPRASKTERPVLKTRTAVQVYPYCVFQRSGRCKASMTGLDGCTLVKCHDCPLQIIAGSTWVVISTRTFTLIHFTDCRLGILQTELKNIHITSHFRITICVKQILKKLVNKFQTCSNWFLSRI